jgi:hypothetical protein
VIDLSAKGARVSVENPPGVGVEVFLVLPSADLYARIVWETGSECGLRFDGHLSTYEVARLGW